MSRASLKLEVFETAPLTEEAGYLDPHQAVQLRDSAFEEGYAAGWHDALEQFRQEDDLRRIAAEEALQTLSFTYHEALQSCEASVMPLIEAIIGSVLPEALRKGVAYFLAEELRALITTHATCEITLKCAPSARRTFEPVIAGFQRLAITLVDEPSFSDAQVALSIGPQTRVIDLDQLQDRLNALFMSASSASSHKESVHGHK